MDEDERDWEDLYKRQAVETMPWYWPKLDPDFKKALTDLNITSGRVLDMGTGPGTQAIALAKMGFEVTATDISATAVSLAAARAKKEGLNIDLRQDNILRTKLDETFDYILDRGLFHVVPPQERHVYVNNVSRLLGPGGYLLLKCFSDKEKGAGGPHRLSKTDIRESFSVGWRIILIEDSGFPGKDRPERRALFVVIAKALF